MFLNDNCEIYEYQHFNQQTSPKNSNCPFCNPEPNQELIAETAITFAIYDKFPVNKGHALIIPKRHCASYFDLNLKEQQVCWFMVNEVKKIIEDQFHPDGFNVGVNINGSAGQTIPHVHIHLIPRYINDCEDPTGGVRGVIPSKQNYKY